MKRKATSLLLCALVISSSLGLSGCDQAKFVKQKVVDLSIYTDAGIDLTEGFIRDGILNAQQGKLALDLLRGIKSATVIFTEKAQSYTKFDATSKADLARLFVDVVSGVKRLLTEAKPLIIAALQALKSAGAIKGDPAQLLTKADWILNGINTAARLIESRLQ